MASTWGGSWGTSWGASWNRAVVVTPPIIVAQGSGGWYEPPTKHKRKRNEDAPLEPQSDPNPPQAGPAFEPQADTQNYRIAALIERQRLQAMEDDDEEVLMLLL